MRRILAILAVLAVVGNGSLLAQPKEPVEVGDVIILQMKDDLAAEYLRLIGVTQDSEDPQSRHIEATATVARILEDGRICVEHTLPLVRDTKPTKLVTLTATVETAKLTAYDPTKDGLYPTSVWPAQSGNANRTGRRVLAGQMTLLDLRGVKLRQWTLTEQLGDGSL